LPASVRKQLASYRQHCTALFNTQRGANYLRAVQTTTIDKQVSG
jgi:hypothetical protein